MHIKSQHDFEGTCVLRNSQSSKVLVIANNEKTGCFLAYLLKQLGQQAAICRSICDGQRLLMSRQWHLVVTDVVPYESHIKFAHWLNKNQPTLPIIAITSDRIGSQLYRPRPSESTFVTLRKPFLVSDFSYLVATGALPVEELHVHPRCYEMVNHPHARLRSPCFLTSSMEVATNQLDNKSTNLDVRLV